VRRHRLPSLARLSLSALLVVGLLVAPAAVRTAAADAKKEASRHFKLGVDLYGEGKFSEALVEFQRAYELRPHPSVLYNIAATYRELSYYSESIEFFERFLGEGKGVAKKDLIKKAQAELDELRARVGSIVVEAPGGVTLLLDGKEVGAAPLPRPLVVAPGDHPLEARAEDGRVVKKTVRVTAGDETRVALELPALPPPEPTPPPPDPSPPADPIGDALVRKAVPRTRSIGVSAAMMTNVLAIDKTGAPALGLSFRIGSRIKIGADVLLIAFAVVPSVRVRLLGARTSIDLVVAVPVSITDNGETDVFVAGAGGLGLRAFVSDGMALRADALVSAATGGHGVTVPVTVGAELWF
jgi:hypothetical protein